MCASSFSVDDVKRQIIKHMCIGQKEMLIVYSTCLERSDFENLLKSLRYCQCPRIYKPTIACPLPFYIRYSASLLLGEERSKADLMQLYLDELKQMGKSWSNSLHAVLALQDSQYTIQSLCRSVASLYRTSRPLFYALQDRFISILERSAPRDLIETLQLDLFEILKVVNTAILSEFDFKSLVDNTNIASFLQNQTILFDEGIAKLVQLVFGLAEPYPLKSRLFKEPSYFSLMNDCIFKRKLFLDILYRFCYSALDDFERTKSVMTDFPEMLPYFYLMNLHVVDSALLPTLAEHEHDPHGIFKRLLGDDNLVTFMRSTVGVFLTPEHLKSSSVVSYMTSLLSSVSLDSLQRLWENQFLVISDADKQKEMNVMFGYRAINAILTGNTAELEKIIPLITNKEIYVDMFSVLFVRDHSGKYVCDAETASALVDLLMDVWDEGKEYLVAAKMRMTMGMYMSSHKSISKCFLNPVETISHLFALKDFSKAMLIAQPLPKLYKKCEVARAMCMLRQTFTSPYIEDPDVRNDLNIEYGLSTFDVLDYAIASCKASEDVLQLLKRRAAKRGMDKIGAVPQPRVLEMLAKKGAEFFEGQESEVLPTAEHDLLNGFMRYLEMFRKFATSSGNTIQDIMDSIIQSDDIPDWTALSEILGDHALEKLLSSFDIGKASVKLVHIVREISELIALVIQLSANLEQSVIPVNEVIQKWQDKSTIQPELPSLMSLSESDYNIVKKQIFEKKPVDAKEVIDLRLMFMDEVDDDLDFYQRELSFQDFLLVFPEYSSSVVDNIECDCAEPEAVIESLFRAKTISPAFQIAKLFGKEDFCEDLFVKIVSDCLDTNTDFRCYFSDCPQLSMKIYNKLPERFNNSMNQFAFLSIQNDTINMDMDLDDYETCLELLRAFPELDCDKQLVQITEKEITESGGSFETLKRVIDNFIPVMKHPHLIMSIICNSVFGRIEQIRVSSKESEQNALNTVLASLKVLRKAKMRLTESSIESFGYETQVLQIEFLVKFTECLPFSKFGFVYSFAGFRQADFISSLISIVCKTDIHDILQEISGLRSLSLSSVRYDTLTKMFSLGLFDAGRRLVHTEANWHAKNENDSLTLEHCKSILAHPSPMELLFCDINESGDGEQTFVTVVPLSKQISFISISSYVRSVMSMERMSALPQIDLMGELIERVEAEFDQIVFYCSIGNIYKAFEKWSNLAASRKTAMNAIKLIIIPCMSFGYWNTLWQYIKSNQYAMQVFKPLLPHIFSYCVELGMKDTLYSIQFSLGLFEDAILSLMMFMRLDPSWEVKMTNVTHLVQVLQRESNRRMKDQTIFKFKIPENELKRLINVAGLQLLFVRLCIDQNLPYDPRKDLISNPDSVEDVAATALFHKKFNLGLQTAELKEDSLIAILDMLLDKMKGHGLGDYFKLMKMRLDTASYEYLCTELVNAVAARAANRKDVPKFIVSVVSGACLQIKLLIDLEYLPEALTLCERSHNLQEIPKVLEAAKQCGNKSVEQKCIKIMAKK